MTLASAARVGDELIDSRLACFPTSRYMGSKQAILPFIHGVVKDLPFESALDAFSGSGAVGYLFKAMGKAVTCNDFLHFAYHTADACVANSRECLEPEDIDFILRPNPDADTFIQTNFAGLYFTDEENALLDRVSANIRALPTPAKRSIAIAALARASLRKRPRGVFTYTGVRYVDGRRDLSLTLEEQFRAAVARFNGAVFDNGHRCEAHSLDVFELPMNGRYDLVYLDPPYVSPHSDNDYTRRYHFVEGLARYWEGLQISEHTLTKKFPRIPSAFDSRATVYDAFERLFDGFRDSIIVVSYSSNGYPSRDELAAMLGRYKGNVAVHEFEHRYSFGTHAHKVGRNRNSVKEYLFVGR